MRLRNANIERRKTACRWWRRTARTGWMCSIRCDKTGAVEKVPASSVFVFIGAQPRTSGRGRGGSATRADSSSRVRDLFVNGAAEGLDCRSTHAARNQPAGAFAVGDVRHGSGEARRVRVGEGSIAIQFVHQYLAEATTRKAANHESRNDFVLLPAEPMILRFTGSRRTSAAGGTAGRRRGGREHGSPVTRMFAILEGTFRRDGGGDSFQIEAPGDITGMPPYSRLKVFPGTARAVVRSRAASLSHGILLETWSARRSWGSGGEHHVRPNSRKHARGGAAGEAHLAGQALGPGWRTS